MASYLDNIPTFNEYVEQRPQDDMLKVGLFKQQRYEQGVQKIQSSIDNIAGLDVVRDVDKKYLQSKLNALGGQLSGVAASDFSNFQLVSTVDGMTNQLVKDPNVLNAVGSAAKYRKQLENQEKINMDGKGSQSNDWLFNLQSQQWFDGGLDDSFNAQYNPYVDYNKKAMEIVKNLASDSVEGDVYMGRDKNGRTAIYNVLTRTKVEGISADKIQTALMAGLSPDEFNQLNVDGRYEYSNVQDDQFAQGLNDSYSQTFDGLLETRSELEGIMSTTQDPSQKLIIQKQIESIDAESDFLKQEYENISSSFTQGDVESAKAKLYSTNWMRDFSNSFSNRNYSETIHTNPARVDQLKLAQMEADAARHAANYAQKERLAATANAIERDKLKLAQNPYGGVSQNGGDESTDTEIVAYAELEKQATAERLAALKERFMRNHGIDGKVMTGVQMQNTLQQYEDNANSVSIDQENELQEISKLTDEYIRMSNTISSLKKEAEFEFPNTEVERLNKTVQFTGDDGVEYSIDYASMTDLFENKFMKYVYSDAGDEFPDEIPSWNVRKAQEELDPADLEVFNKIFLPGYDRSIIYGITGNSSSNVYDDWASTQPRLQEEINNNSELRTEFLAEALRKTSIIPQKVSYGVPLTNTAEKQGFASVLQGVSNDLRNLDSDKAQSILEIASNLSSANVITRGTGENYELTITGKGDSGNDVQVDNIQLTEAQYREIFSNRFDESPSIKYFNDNFLPSMLDTRAPLEFDENRSFKSRRQNLGYWTTSLDSQYQTNSRNTSLKGRRDFPNIQYYTVKGNLVTKSNPKSNGGLFYLQLNIKDPTTGVTIPNVTFPGPLVKEKIASTLQALSDEDIYKILNGVNATMTEEYYNKLVKASKNPTK